ncbi:hypothetical protein O9929_18695 [Vibrio lentus]|nr:hypothetical protein [Vibrio lentus]
MEHDIDPQFEWAVLDSNRSRNAWASLKMCCGVEGMCEIESLESIPYIANSWQGKQADHQFMVLKVNKTLFNNNKPVVPLTLSQPFCLV